MTTLIVCEEVTSGWKMIHVDWRYELLEKWHKVAQEHKWRRRQITCQLTIGGRVASPS